MIDLKELDTTLILKILVSHPLKTEVGLSGGRAVQQPELYSTVCTGCTLTICWWIANTKIWD
jgi:hypothetical protein